MSDPGSLVLFAGARSEKAALGARSDLSVSLAMPDSEPSKSVDMPPDDVLGRLHIVSRPVPKRRNQLFLVTLATVITSIFLAVMVFAFIFHYAAAHHSLAHL